jgi:hypothetical protein
MGIELAADLRHLADANSGWKLIRFTTAGAGAHAFLQEFAAVLRR